MSARSAHLGSPDTPKYADFPVYPPIRFGYGHRSPEGYDLPHSLRTSARASDRCGSPVARAILTADPRPAQST